MTRPLLLGGMLGLLALAGCRMSANPSRDPTVAAAAPAPAANTTATTPTAGATPEVDIRCDSDADCQVKDIGSCCGYYPRCVNKDSPTFADQVKAQCAKEGRSGVCGFPSVRGCSCVAHQCVNEVGPAQGAQ